MTTKYHIILLLDAITNEKTVKLTKFDTMSVEYTQRTDLLTRHCNSAKSIFTLIFCKQSEVCWIFSGEMSYWEFTLVFFLWPIKCFWETLYSDCPSFIRLIEPAKYFNKLQRWQTFSHQSRVRAVKFTGQWNVKNVFPRGVLCTELCPSIHDFNIYSLSSRIHRCAVIVTSRGR